MPLPTSVGTYCFDAVAELPGHWIPRAQKYLAVTGMTEAITQNTRLSRPEVVGQHGSLPPPGRVDKAL
jgi:hypothetical protein